MPLSSQDVKPFFQVLLFKTPDGFDLADMQGTVLRQVQRNNPRSPNKFEHYDKSDLPHDNPSAFVFKHTFPPSWYRSSREGRTDTPLRNREYDFVLFYLNDESLFVHVSCSKLRERVSTAIRQYRVGTDNVRSVDATLLKRILDNTDVRFMSVGIDNIFNPGGMAPEAKAYHGRSADQCVTPSFDAGFGISYFLGRDVDNKSAPFGGSFNKKKVWRTWVDDLDTFQKECDNIVDLMSKAANRKHLDILAEPISPVDVDISEVLMFYLDYTTEKGTVILKSENVLYHDWSVDLDHENTGKILVSLLDEGREHRVIGLEFAFDNESKAWNFGVEGEADLSVVVADEEGNEDQPIPVTDFLRQRNGYTFVLTNGRAYKNGGFWSDNRFTYPFKGSDIEEIPDWKGVDIKHESRPPDPPFDMNILQRLEREFRKGDYIYIIKDDDANEVADYIVISDKRIILAHAKRSKDANPALRVDDLHVVCSQAIKNLRFFAPGAYRDTHWQRFLKPNRLTRNSNHDNETEEDFKNRFTSYLRNRTIRKECWIVQPGISLKELVDKGPDNKVHCLLNFVQSACMASNVEFKLICSA